MSGRIHGSWRTSIPTGDDAPDASPGGASEETDVTGSADTAGDSLRAFRSLSRKTPGSTLFQRQRIRRRSGAFGWSDLGRGFLRRRRFDRHCRPRVTVGADQRLIRLRTSGWFHRRTGAHGTQEHGLGAVRAGPRYARHRDLARRIGRNVLHFFVPPGMAIDDPVAFAPPPAFGPFRVLHQIGIGALGPVFRTYEPTRDRLVAVKVFRLDITPEQAQLLADELAIASDAGLFHPSIVEPIAAGVEGTVAYRAEEYVAAESLDAAIRHYAPAPLDKALPFLTQLAGAIDFARTAGIGHGSLHLRDIFVTPEEARASGFGVVESLERMGLRAPVRRPYSAPERIAGASWGTPADVFSLAAITYELLTGRRPSGTGEQLGPLSGEHLAEFGAGMRTVLARAMDEDPLRRYPTALAFASALEAAARGGRVTEAVTAVGEITDAAAPPARIAFADDTEPDLHTPSRGGTGRHGGCRRARRCAGIQPRAGRRRPG